MRVVIAMSGGVDSAVAALRLREEGYEVIGVTMKTWPREDCGRLGDRLCCSLDAIQFARSAAEDIGIPHYVVDLSREFKEEVRGYFVSEYSRGRTPNPCIYCNSRIKFGHLFRKALELGAHRISTGHYARVTEKEGDSFLSEALDRTQDQSYFLYGIKREVLPRILFPLGSMSKKEVREIASNKGFMSASRRSSQDICFTSGKGGYREYLSETGVNGFLPGEILDVYGNVIGEHKGIAAYTIGQRHGLGLGLHYQSYVIKIDPVKNTLTVGKKAHAMKRTIRVGDLNWLGVEVGPAPRVFDVRIRYKGRKGRALVSGSGEDEVTVEFEEPQFAPAPGQAAVFYSGEIVAGGGWIK